MKIDIRNLKKIDQILSKNKEIKKREYNKTDNLSNRKWFVVEYTQPLTPNLKEFIEQAQKLDIDLTSSLTKISMVNRFYDELINLNGIPSVINDYGEIDLIHIYETNLNHKNDSIDFENKRIVKRYFYPND